MLLGAAPLGRYALGQLPSPTNAQATPLQAAGVGVAGTIRGSDAEGLTGVAGIGVAGGIIASPAALLIGVSGIGTAGLLGKADSEPLAGVVGIGVAGSITLRYVNFLGVAGGGSAGSLSGPNVVPNAPFFGGYDGIVSGRYALGQITGTRTDGGVSITVTLAPAIGTGHAGSFTPAPSTGLVGVSGGGVAGTITANPVWLLIGVSGQGIAGRITVTISGAGSSAGAAAGDGDRRRKRKTGFEPVTKQWPPEPIGTEEHKPLPLPPFSVPPLAPADERSPLDLVDPDLIPPDLIGLQDQIFAAQDSYRRGNEQDEQDAADIADVLALLD